jgi:uncharacterized membrane protein SpoIIM required for sporulation
MESEGLMTLTWWKKASPLNRRLMMVAFVFVSLAIILSIGTLMPISQIDAEKANDEITQQVNDLQAKGLLVPYIFGNNFMITLIMFIPFLGPLFGGYVIFNTGTVIGARAVANNIPPLLWVASLFLTPVGWLEFAAYSLAIAGSIWLTIRVFQSRMMHELRNTAKFVTIAAVILLVSAVIEAVEIMLS